MTIAHGTIFGRVLQVRGQSWHCWSDHLAVFVHLRLHETIQSYVALKHKQSTVEAMTLHPTMDKMPHYGDSDGKSHGDSSPPQAQDDLIAALLTSCHIPWWLDNKLTTQFRGMHHFDGGLTNFIPVPPEASAGIRSEFSLYGFETGKSVKSEYIIYIYHENRKLGITWVIAPAALGDRGLINLFFCCHLKVVSFAPLVSEPLQNVATGCAASQQSSSTRRCTASRSAQTRLRTGHTPWATCWPGRLSPRKSPSCGNSSKRAAPMPRRGPSPLVRILFCLCCRFIQVLGGKRAVRHTCEYNNLMCVSSICICIAMNSPLPYMLNITWSSSWVMLIAKAVATALQGRHRR